MNKEISAQEASILRDNKENALFLDVREDSELAICRIDGALHIPMAEIPARSDALPREDPLIIFCHHGMRSQHVIHFLESKGFTNTLNLTGGIHAWAAEVDPSMRRY